jgi:tetratricopeptide (TPR) repeat protein
MMKQIFTLILVFITVISFAQEDAIDGANKLIQEKKYESAFNILNGADLANENPDIAIAKTDLVLKYFVTSIMHKTFALKDLEPAEEIMDIRGSNGNFTIHAFAPDSILNTLIKKYPDNYNLRKSLGYYYHEVHLNYQENWLEPDSVVTERFLDNYKLAYDNGISDYWSVSGIGYAYLIKQDFKSSIKYLEESTKLKNDDPSGHYNLAYAYMFTDQREKGIRSAKTAMGLYDNPKFKADAARMIATLYRELKDFENASIYYKRAAILQPEDYYTIKSLFEFELSLNKEEYPERTKEFFILAPGNPTIYQDLLNAYKDYEKENELFDFFSSLHNRYMEDNRINGNLYLYKAVIQYDKEDFELSKANFDKSRDLLEKIFEPDHHVFELINSYTNEIN